MLQADPSAKQRFVEALQSLAAHQAPFSIYALILHHLFGARGDEWDEERIVKSATGIRNTMVWKKLYKFQRDGVVGAIEKLNRFGGCIIADSVGLGKTFEALAIIKYHELRNDRVLVLCPKRLRDNWTLYRASHSGSKAEFAHRLTEHLAIQGSDGKFACAFEVPNYLSEAINYVVENSKQPDTPPLDNGI